MKVHRKIIITGCSGKRGEFDATLRMLCRQMPHWWLDAKGSKSYTTGAGRPSYLIAYNGDTTLPPLVVALTLNGGRKRLRFHSPNIFPQQSGQITCEEYNAAAVLFVAALKATPGFDRSGWLANVTPDNVGLETIIPGKRCREFFTAYLHGYPLTYHGSDIRNLDLFICALHRFRADVSPDRVGAYLIEDRGWKEADAYWVRNRIRSGLEVLAANRAF